MKQSLILWLSAIIITFLTGFFRSNTDEFYPASGTLSFGKEKISFLFDKIHYGNDDYKIIIRTDFPDVTGEVKWRYNGTSDEWRSIPLIYKERVLTASLPSRNVNTRIEYKGEIVHNNKNYSLPLEGFVIILFKNHVPSLIKIFLFLTLFTGILLFVRGGLESFNEKPYTKYYIYPALLFWALGSLIFSNLFNAYADDVSFLVSFITPGYSEIIQYIILLLWVIIIVTHLNTNKKIIIASSFLTIILFATVNLFS